METPHLGGGGSRCSGYTRLPSVIKSPSGRSPSLVRCEQLNKKAFHVCSLRWRERRANRGGLHRPHGEDTHGTLPGPAPSLFLMSHPGLQIHSAKAPGQECTAVQKADFGVRDPTLAGRPLNSTCKVKSAGSVRSTGLERCSPDC